jgi:hypothetical protein
VPIAITCRQTQHSLRVRSFAGRSGSRAKPWSTLDQGLYLFRAFPRGALTMLMPPGSPSRLGDAPSGSDRGALGASRAPAESPGGTRTQQPFGTLPALVVLAGRHGFQKAPPTEFIASASALSL